MGHRITSGLSALNIARSTYYQWKNWQPSQRETRYNALKTAIKAVYNTNPSMASVLALHFED
ncbi:hypothetical protein [Weissella confusa]